MQGIFKITKGKGLFLCIVVLAGFLRFYGLNWDQNQHLHPDERFLTMVGNAMKVPQSFTDYLNPKISTLNPENIGFTFFVYGVFPVTFNKIAAIIFQNDTYNSFTLQGRFLSGLADLLIIFFLFKTVELFEKKYTLDKSIKYWASFFYAIAVLPIQLSHFFAVDTFLNLFMFASFYFALRFSLLNKYENVVLSAFFFGLALASKLTAFFIIPLIGCLFMMALFFNKHRRQQLLFLGCLFILFAIIAYITVRVADPYLFEDSNILNPKVSQLFLANIKSLKSFEGSETWFPPAIQWIHKPPILFSLFNLAFFGVGLPYFLFVTVGIYQVIKTIRKPVLYIILLWVLLFFLYQSTEFAKTIRYFIFIYPFLAIFAGIGLAQLILFMRKHVPYLYIFVVCVYICSILVWPLAFFSIYTKEHSRVTASRWIYIHVVDGSLIVSEHWDDGLPLGLVNSYGKIFKGEQLPVFDGDTEEKWTKISSLLTQANYYILSSNRAWGSITTVPDKYPRMSRFYEDLFAERLPFRKVEEVTSYPSLRYLGIPLDFPDDWAEETFTVYDHPKVIIFKKEI